MTQSGHSFALTNAVLGERTLRGAGAIVLFFAWLVTDFGKNAHCNAADARAEKRYYCTPGHPPRGTPLKQLWLVLRLRLEKSLVNTERIEAVENEWDFDPKRDHAQTEGGWPRACLASVANNVRFRG
jgi:hypothetical protein